MMTQNDNGTPRKFGSLREKIAAEKSERAARYAEFAAIHDRAHEAGMKAGEACMPRPMGVRRAMIDPATGADIPIGPVHVVHEGACGFAWVTVRPGNCSFAKWAAKERGWDSAYGGGKQLWVRWFGQSVERKDAYASAFAKVLQEAGIKAYAGSRLD